MDCCSQLREMRNNAQRYDMQGARFWSFRTNSHQFLIFNTLHLCLFPHQMVRPNRLPQGISGSTGSQGVDTEPHALASGPVLTRAVLPPEIPLSRISQGWRQAKDFSKHLAVTWLRSDLFLLAQSAAHELNLLGRMCKDRKNDGSTSVEYAIR
jgi:hypothetical protein